MCDIIVSERNEREKKKMANLPRYEYLNNNDLLGAYGRYNETIARWKDYWWEAVETIYNSAKEWTKHFIIDSVNRILKRITRGRLPMINSQGYLEYQVEADGCGAYLVKHFDSDNKPLWIKCGKADDVQKRLIQHFKKDYRDIAQTGIVLGWFPCKNSNHALSMEDVIRNYFEQKGFELLGKDRFPKLTEISEADLNELNRRAKILAELF
jgi:hypothetical protein